MSASTPGARRAVVAIAAVACAAMAAVGVVLLTPHRAQQHSDAAWAQALFEGGLESHQGQGMAGALPPLRGRLNGHTIDLPAAATRCINCHAGVATTDALGAAAFATPLHAGTLLHAMSRRGGPPSTYDAASLCRVLRDGIDPAFVIVDQAMPRYPASDAQCAALWTWLTRPRDR